MWGGAGGQCAAGRGNARIEGRNGAGGGQAGSTSLIGSPQEPGSKRDASKLWLHSPRPFRDPRVSLSSHRGWALSLSTALVLLLLVLAPATWVRWLIPPPPRVPAPPDYGEEAPPDEIQLIPYAAIQPPRPSPEMAEVRVELPREEEEVEPEEEAEPVTEDATEAWNFDPTRPHDIARDLIQLERGQQALADSTLARAQLYRELAPGRWAAGALVDTSRMAWVKSRWREFDEWINRVRGPEWIAEGDSARKAEIYDRAVTEVEREGLH